MSAFSQQMMPQQVISAAVELLINKALSLNIEGTLPLAALEQKTLAVQLTEPIQLGFSFTVHQGKVLVTHLIDSADCVIITSLSALSELKQQQALTQLIKTDQLDIQGDLKVAQQFIHLAENIDIDWQSELAAHIGDLATHKLTHLAKRLGNQISFSAEQIQADASEWLVHEQRLVVTKSQIKHFNQAVSQVAEQTQAIEQRLEKLLAARSARLTVKDNCE